MSETKKKILFLDDEEEFVQLLADYFQNDFTVAVETDPRDALERLKKEKFNLIVSDFMMPGMNGRDLIKSLRERGDQTPVFFLSGMFELRVVKDLVNLGAACLFTKPLDFPEFQRNVKGFLLGEVTAEEPPVPESDALLETDESADNVRSFLPLLTRGEEMPEETLDFLRNVGLAVNWNRDPGDTLANLRSGSLTGKDRGLPTAKRFVASQRDQQLALLWQLYNGDRAALAGVTGLDEESWLKWATAQGWGISLDA